MGDPTEIKAVLSDLQPGTKVTIELGGGRGTKAGQLARHDEDQVVIDTPEGERRLELAQIDRVLLDAPSLPEGPE